MRSQRPAVPRAEIATLGFFVLRHFQTCLSTLNFVGRNGKFGLALGSFQEVFSLGERLLGTWHVNLFGRFDSFGEHRHAVWQHFGESPCHGEAVQLAVRTIADLPRAEFRDQGSMARQHAKVAVASWNLYLVRRVADDQFFGSNDFELEIICHLRSEPLFTTEAQGHRKNKPTLFCVSVSLW